VTTVTIVSDLDAAATALATWVVTFTVHGIIACIAALLCGRFLLRRAASRDLLWKGALVLPIATSFLSVSAVTLPLADFVRRASPVEVRPPEVVVTVMRQGGYERRARRVRDVAGSSLAVLVLTLAFSNAAIGGVRYCRRRRALDLELAGTWPTAIPPRVRAELIAPFPELRLMAGPHLLSPLALGRSTVCVPAVSFTTLNETQQAGVLAHEVAHLTRRDPYWIGIAEWLAAIVPFGFALRVVVLEMRRDSELLCDAAAARALRSPVALVEALSLFVRDLEAARGRPLRVGYADSPVVERARRLLYGPLETPRPDQWVWAVLVVIGAFAVTAPRATLKSTMGPPGGKDTVTRHLGHAGTPPGRSRTVVRPDGGCVQGRAASCSGVGRRGMQRDVSLGRRSDNLFGRGVRQQRYQPSRQWPGHATGGPVRFRSGSGGFPKASVNVPRPASRGQTRVTAEDRARRTLGGGGWGFDWRPNAGSRYTVSRDRRWVRSSRPDSPSH
jgi:Zn-dependent protease with chaperone function